MSIDEFGAEERRGVRAALAVFDAIFDAAGPDADEWDTVKLAVVAARDAQRKHGWKSAADVAREGRALREAEPAGWSVQMIAEELKALCGPGDHGEPVVTIMKPEED